MRYSLAILALCLCFVGCNKKDEWPEFKTCQRCKETDIKYWADVCKHCGKDPDGPNGAEKRAELTKIWLESKRSSRPDEKPVSKEQSAFVEKAIRKSLKKPTGELTKADFEKVTRLGLVNTKITDEGLKEVAKLQQLSSLKLALCRQITDEGLKELAKLKNLERLEFIDCGVTKAGLAELQRALPDCKIYHDIGRSAVMPR